jgi:hypothetical protein
MAIMEAFEDSNHRGNSSIYHTGKKCIEQECKKPAGTAWSPYYCFDCNVKRIKRIDSQLKNILRGMRNENREKA